jgi:ABC-type transport system substrate-binding protein
LFAGADPGAEIRTVKNPDWWGTPSNVDDVRYIWRGESVVRASMIEVGEADITPDIAVQDATNWPSQAILWGVALWSAFVSCGP